MAVLQIDTLSDGETPYYRQSVRLDDQTYLLDLKYNFRTEVWVLSLYLEDGTPLALGQNVLPGKDLLRYSKSQQKPSGTLTCVAKDGRRKAPALKDLGNGFGLYYFPEGEALE